MRCRLELPSLEREETEHPGSGGGKDGRQLLEGRSAGIGSLGALEGRCLRMADYVRGPAATWAATAAAAS